MPSSAAAASPSVMAAHSPASPLDPSCGAASASEALLGCLLGASGCCNAVAGRAAFRAAMLLEVPAALVAGRSALARAGEPGAGAKVPIVADRASLWALPTSSAVLSMRAPSIVLALAANQDFRPARLRNAVRMALESRVSESARISSLLMGGGGWSATSPKYFAAENAAGNAVAPAPGPGGGGERPSWRKCFIEARTRGCPEGKQRMPNTFQTI